MAEKIKCNRCGTSHYGNVCPVCGETLVDDNINEVENNLEEQEHNKFFAKLDDTNPTSSTSTNSRSPEDLEQGYINPARKYFTGLVKFPSREIKVELWKNVTLFLTGLIGLSVVAFVVSFLVYFIAGLAGIETINESALTAASNFGTYFIIFGILLIILSNNILPIIEDCKKGMSWLKGLYYGVILIICSIIVSLIFSSFGEEITDNENQTIVESIVVLYPVLSIIVLGIIGPICEEFTYRIGLFSALKRLGRTWAYIICAIIFGFIHFDFFSDDIVNELLNIPSYIVAGALLCYFYEKSGITTSIVAHCTNNLFSIIITILYSYLV